MTLSCLCKLTSTVVLGLTLALPLEVAFVTEGAHAQEARKKVERPRKKAPRRASSERRGSDAGREFLRDPEELPFGSTVWWRAMDLRNRGGFGSDS